MENMGRQHPVRLLSYTTRYFWLLIIPLVRSLYSLSFEIDALRVWLRGAWLDLLVLFAIICFAWIRWMSVCFAFDDKKIVLNRGVYLYKEDTVYYSQISTISIKQNFIYRLLGASTVSISTRAGSLDRSSLKITMSRVDADRLYSAVKNSRCRGLNYSVSTNKLRLILFSMLFSSALSGVLIIIALLLETGEVFDREVEARLLLDTLTEVVNWAAVYVPPIISLIIIVVAGAWALSFVSNIFMFWGFVLTKCVDSLYVKSGIWAKNRHIIQRSMINFIDLKQSFSSKVAGVSSLHVSCSGYGSTGRDELTVVMPITTRKEIDGTINEVFPEYPKPKIQLKSDPKSYFGFYMPAVLLAVFPAVDFYLAYKFLPGWYAVIYPAMAITVMPAIFLAMCKTLSMFITGAGFSEDFITLRYSKWYTFHTVIVKKENIAKIVVRQSIFQRFSGLCTVIVYTVSEKRERHLIYGMRLDRTLNIFERNGYDLYYSER